MHIDTEVATRGGIRVSGAIDEIVYRDRVASLYPPRFTNTDVVGRRHNTDILPGPARPAQRSHLRVHLRPAAQCRLREVIGIDPLEAVLVVRHEQEEIIANVEKGRMAV